MADRSTQSCAGLDDPGQLMRLLDVYELQARKMETQRLELLARRSDLDELMRRLTTDEELVQAQRLMWAHQRQSWLKEGGTLRHIRTTSDHHLQLLEMEGLIDQRRIDINARMSAVQEEIENVLNTIRRHQKKIEQATLRREISLRQEMQAMERRNQSTDDERVLGQWFRGKLSGATLEVSA